MKNTEDSQLAVKLAQSQVVQQKLALFDPCPERVSLRHTCMRIHRQIQALSIGAGKWLEK